MEHKDLVSCVAVVNGNRAVVSGSHDTRLLVWNLDKGDVEHQLLGHTGHVTAVSVTADGSTVISGMYFLIKFRNFEAVTAWVKIKNRIFGPGRRVPKSYSGCCCCYKFSKDPEIPKAFLIRSGA